MVRKKKGKLSRVLRVLHNDMTEIKGNLRRTYGGGRRRRRP